MNLWHDSFTKIKEKSKTIEMRLYDEKRSKIQLGDEIVFTNTSNNETIKCSVINLYKYDDFFDLYHHHDSKDIGYDVDQTANPNDMLEYYLQDEIQKYGAVGIELRVI